MQVEEKTSKVQTTQLYLDSRPLLEQRVYRMLIRDNGLRNIR